MPNCWKEGPELLVLLLELEFVLEFVFEFEFEFEVEFEFEFELVLAFEFVVDVLLLLTELLLTAAGLSDRLELLPLF